MDGSRNTALTRNAYHAGPTEAVHVKFTVFYQVEYHANSSAYHRVEQRTHTGRVIVYVRPGVNREEKIQNALLKEWAYVKEVKEACSEKNIERHNIVYTTSTPSTIESQPLTWIPMQAFSPLQYDDFDTEERPEGDVPCVYAYLFRLYASRYRLDYKKLLRIFADEVKTERVGWDASRNPITKETYFYKGCEFDEFSGVTAEQLDRFAKAKKINIFGYGLDGSCFLKGVYNNGKSKAHPIVFLLGNGHLYPLRHRRSLSHCVSARINSRPLMTYKNLLEKVTRVEKATREADSLPRTHYTKVQYAPGCLASTPPETVVYWTETDDMFPLVYKIISAEKRIPSDLTVVDGRLIGFCYSKAKKVWVSACPEWVDLVEVFAVLTEKRPDLFPVSSTGFCAASFAQVGKIVFDAFHPDHTVSFFGAEAESIYNGGEWRHCGLAFNVECWGCDTEDLADPRLVGVDISKCYAAATLESEFDWPVFTPFDVVEPFDGMFKAGLYYVATDNYFPFRGNGWYVPELVKYALHIELIETSQVRYQLVSTKRLPCDYFKDVLVFLFENFPPAFAKRLFMFYGMFAKFEREMVGKVILTYDHYEAGHYFAQYEGAFVEEMNDEMLGNFERWCADKTPRSEHTDGVVMTDLSSASSPDTGGHLYRVDIRQKQKLVSNNRPLYWQIIQLGALRVFKLSREMGGRLISVKTDSVLSLGGQLCGAVPPAELEELPPFSQIGQNKLCTGEIVANLQERGLGETYKEISTNEWDCHEFKNEWKEAIEEPEVYPDGSWREWVEGLVEEFVFERKEGFFLQGKAGTGKTWFARMVKDIIDNRAEEDPKNVVCLAPTNVAALLLKGSTIDKMFGLMQDGSHSMPVWEVVRKNNIGYIIGDEISMQGEHHYAQFLWLKIQFPDVIFILVGDFRQCAPVESADDPMLQQKDLDFVRHLLRGYRYGDKRSGRQFNLTVDYVVELLRQDGSLCHWCGVELRWHRNADKAVRGSIDRKDNDVGHIEGNVHPSCLVCNLSRNRVTYADWKKFGNVHDPGRHDYKHSYVLKQLCDFNKIKLTQNKRSNSEMWDVCGDVMSPTIYDKLSCDVFCWRNLVYTNKMRKIVNAYCMDAASDVNAGEVIELDCAGGRAEDQPVVLMVDTPLIAKKSDKVNYHVLKNETFRIVSFNWGEGANEEDSFTVERIGNAGGENVTVKVSDFQPLFHVAFAITVHRSQSASFDFPYAIYEYGKMNKNLRYTALTRTTKKEYVHLNKLPIEIFNFYKGLLKL